MSRNYYTIVAHPESPTALATCAHLEGDGSWIEFRRFCEEGELGDTYRRTFNIEKLFELFEENEKLKAEIGHLRGELEKKESQTDCALTAKDAIISLKDMRIAKLDENLKELRKALVERDEYIARLEKEAGDKTSDDENLNSRIAELNDTVASQAGKLLKKDVEIAGLNLTIGTKDAVIEIKNKECQVLSAENEELKKTLAERDAEIHKLKIMAFNGDTVAYRRLQVENEKLKETVALRDERVGELYHEVRVLRGDRARHDEKVSELCQNIDRLKKTCADLTRERDILKKSLAERDETINKQYEIIKEFREGYSKIRSEIAYIRSTINTKWNIHPSAWRTSIWDECEDQIHEIRENLVVLPNPVKTSLGVGVISIDFNKWSKLRKKLSKKEVKLERLEREIKEIKDAMHKA